MKKISLDEFLRLRKLVYRSARPLDYTKWRFLFENGSCDDFLSVLSSYQNEAGAYLLNDGWVGMQGIPSNNDFAHMPWFHFDSQKAAEADIGVTKRLADFILKYADGDSSIYCKAESLKERYRQCGQVLLNGYPDYDPAALNIQAFDPATYPSWLPLPVYFVGSPESSFYPGCRRTVDMNLDAIIDSLLSTHELRFPSSGELDAYEQSNPHPDGKRWCVAEQTIGNYYWGSNFIIRDLDILRKFDRLDFDLPVLI